uniref:Rad21/Rec8-like protein N-terminal domain-containing protein n=1 Tax=Oryza glumipatula TaxID=40148 RepID=A0A0E0A392_9ORYZ
MFYSHQLLARKAPLGQIWMAATLHSKINRKRLDKLDIIKICEEILNPSVPMALRLSGILMGGVAIVYERKVKALYDYACTNSSHRLRSTRHGGSSQSQTPPYFPRAKPKPITGAKGAGLRAVWYEAVTLPENIMDMDVEQPMLFSEADTTRFRGMRLEDLDDQYINVNLDDDDFSRAENHHQENITLADNFGSGLGETDVFNRFERFDITDDDATFNVTPDGHPQVPSNLVPSPPRQEDSPQQQENHHAASSPLHEEAQQGGASVKNEQEQQKMKGQQPAKSSKRKKRRKDDEVMMDNDQIMIPGNVYQTWLKDPSSLITKRHRINSKVNLIRSIKIRDLMDLPLVSLISSLEKSPLEFYYPKELVQLWKECTEIKSPKAPSSGYYTICSFLSPFWITKGTPQVDNDREMGFHPVDFADDIEKLRGNTSGEYGRDYDAFHSDHSVTPGSPGLSRRSASSSGGSGRGFTQLDPEVQLPSGRSKRQHSSGKSFGNLDPVEEEFPFEQELRDFKMRRLSDVGPTPDLLEEIEPTQTPYEKKSNPIDQVTQSIHSYLKLHFDTPGASQSESLSQLAHGMTTAKAARLFYQACDCSHV